MAFLLLTRLMALMSVVFSGSPAVILHAFPDHHLNVTDIAHTTVVVRKCDCRLMCMTDETCRAVTATGDGERATCAFSHTPLPRMTSAVAGAITYIKSVPCEAPYELVNGVGCLWFSNFNANFSTAKASCPKNGGVTGLASPITDTIYWKMIAYIISKGNIPSRFWIGIERIDQVWVWKDGHTIPSIPGTSLWGSYDPNEGLDCANIVYNLQWGLHYRLVDDACSRKIPFICEMR